MAQAGVQWAERDPIGLLAGASPTNGSLGLPLVGEAPARETERVALGPLDASLRHLCKG